MTDLAVPALAPDWDVLRAGMAYAEHGWYVLPIRIDTDKPKHPGSILGSGWPEKTSRDPKQLAAWFAGTNYGLALHCGRSGAVSFDVDTPESIPAALAEEIETVRPPTQASRRNNLQRAHYVFRQPPGRSLGNSVGKLGGEWGEVRGRNGIIVAEPTPHAHPDGKYRWMRGGRVPLLGERVAGLLPDADATTDAATDAQVKAFLDQHTGAARPTLLQAVVDKFIAKVAAGESRHERGRDMACWAMREAKAGYYPARQAVMELGRAFHQSFAGHSRQPDPGEWLGLVAWAIGKAGGADPDAVRTAVDQRVPDVDKYIAELSEAVSTDTSQPTRFAGTLLRRSELASLPPVAPLIDGVLSLRSAAVLFGPTGSGKTFLGLGWACSVGTGTPWLGHEVVRCPTLYVVGEGATGLDVRVSAWEYAWQTKVGDDDVVFSVKPDSFADRRVWTELTAQALDLGARFVVLDTFSSLAPDADETKDAPTFTRRLSDLAAAIDGTALVVHHPGWSDADRTRGGYQLEANVDEVLKLAGSASSDLVELTRKKVKEGPSGERTWLRRRFHQLAIGADGKPYGSVVIEAASAADRALRSVDEAEAVVREVFAVGTVTKAQVRDALAERLDVSRTTAYEHVGRLVTAGLLRRVGGTDQRPVYEVSKP